MTPFRQHYALDTDDRLVRYDEAVRILREQGEPERYYCPGCNREVHISLSAQSFIHNTSRRCAHETYLSNLSVQMLRARFDDGNRDFMIGTKRNVLCKDFRTCPFYTGGYECRGVDIVCFDLKKIYDRCDYPSGELDFSADLVLFSSSGTMPPVYLQIRTDYLAPLDLPPDVLLIEIAVSDERAVELLSMEPILEGGDSVHCLFRGPWKRQGGVSSRRLCEKIRKG